MSGVYVVLEDRSGRFGRISWEAVAAANLLAAQSGAKATAIVIGVQTEALATEAATKGIAKVVGIEHPLLAQYTADGFTAALEQFIRAESPDYVVFPHSYQVRDYVPALAARLGRVLIGDVTSIADGPTFIRSLMQGRLSGNYKSAGAGPCFISVQSGAFRADGGETSAAETTTFAPKLEAAQIRTKPGEPFRGTAQTVDLGSAQLIVCVGRGIKEADNLPLVQDLAAALGSGARRLAAHLRQRLAAHGAPGRQLRPDCRTQALSRRRHLRSHPASCRHEGLAVHRRHQQRRRRPHLRSCRLRHRRRSLRGGTGIN